ncbi:MAG TPA: sulfatase-like hydrolase/transferase [Gaiellaceae bacterium]|nr:sulfatase-like hydrolase/transferase [Gaiellaceae bacterium]
MPDPASDRLRARPVRELGFAGIHLLVLSSFALAQPLFSLLSENVVFFAARGSSRWEIFVFALGVVLVPPLLLLAMEALVGLVHAGAADGLHLIFVGFLSALVVMQVVNRLGDPPEGFFAALVVGAAAGVAFAYARVSAVRSVLTVLAPAPLLFLGLFLFGSPVSKLTLADEAQARPADIQGRAPVVMVVFDEFPSLSLLDRSGRIDPVRFPNFAALAGDATWFRNATTVQGNTSLAVPAILTGRYPRDASKIPIASDYPQNLFTLLGGGYRLNVTEAVTRLCPGNLCSQSSGEGFPARLESLASDLSVVYLHMVLPSDLRDRLPSVTATWGDFRAGGARTQREEDVRRGLDRGFLQKRLFPGSVRDRDLRFRVFADSIRPSRKPELSFLHVLLPHYGWVYLPSGRRYPNAATIAGLVDDSWIDDEALADQGWQRHLLQVGFVDTLLGELVRNLRRRGLYDRSLIVLTADHGVSFRPGAARRLTTAETLPDLAFVPLFVKAPGQTAGQVIDDHVQTVDILPTVADALGISLPWTVDGHSALHRSFRPARLVRIYKTSGGSLAEAVSSMERRRDELLEQKIALFGDRDRWEGLYRFGPHSELVGRRVASADTGPAEGLAVDLDLGERIRVDPETGAVPARITGRLSGETAGAGLDLAVSVDGRIEAVTRSYVFRGDLALSAMVPEASLSAGVHTIEIFQVDASGRLLRIPPRH